VAARSVSPVIRFIHKVADAAGAEIQSDEQLLGCFMSGRDEAAFAELVRRHGPLVLGVCQRVLQDEHDAEDAFQATFLVLVRKAASIHKTEALGSWLHGVAYRVACKAKVTAARRRAHERKVPAMMEADIVDACSWRDLRPVLDEEMQRLPAKYRLPLILCYLQGKTTAETADALGWPRGTVGMRIARGRALLRSRLARRGLSLSAAVVATSLARTEAAMVPPTLVNATVQAAAQMSSGQAAVAISPHILTLAKGAVHAMFLTKLKMMLAVAIAVAAAGTGTTLLTYHAAAADPGPRRTAEAPVLARADDKAKEPVEDEENERKVAANRRRSQNNLKQIGLAMHNYHDVHGHFPASASYKDGKRLLSWRVALLPYLDQEALHQQFKLDEPWDSEHNKKLLAKMPQLFAPPGTKTKKPHTTFYQVFVGQGAMFEGQIEMQIRNITDGLSNTFMAVEAAEAAPWTKPEDLVYDPDKPLPRLGGIFKNGFNALLADGSVRFVSKDAKEDALRKYITRAGNEPIGANDLDP
jgi:RNA polymerase sigma factor (sigma-70 family)